MRRKIEHYYTVLCAGRLQMKSNFMNATNNTLLLAYIVDWNQRIAMSNTTRKKLFLAFISDTN